MVGIEEDLRVQRPEHGIAAEQAGEHQDLGREEEPDAELARVVLLLERLEVVRQVLGMLVVGAFVGIVAWVMWYIESVMV